MVPNEHRIRKGFILGFGCLNGLQRGSFACQWNPEAPTGALSVNQSNDGLINNYRFSASQFEPESGKKNKKLLVFERVRASLYSAVSQSASPRRVRGTARPQAPPAQRQNAWWEEKEVGGREGSKRGGT